MISNHLNERETNWISLEGADLSETLRLESCSDVGEDSAAFRARTGQSVAAEAKAKLYRLDENAAERQLRIWQTIEELRHPNLIRVIESGKKRVAQGEFLYVVFETADEILDRVLGERALDRAEAEEVFLSIIRALNALHANNLVHGAVSPSQVFAVGNTIKLSVEPVRNRGQRALVRPLSASYLAPESAQANITPASDVWCLGATLYEALTQRRTEAGIRMEGLAPKFGSMLTRCLETDPAKRGTLDEIFSIYESGGQKSGAPRFHSAPRIPASVNGDTPPMRRPLPKPLSKGPRLPAWIFGGIALAVLAIFAVWLVRPQNRPKKLGQPARASTPSPAREAPKTPKLSPAHRSDEPQVTPKVEAQAASKEAVRVDARSIWRVVVYTYARLEDAQRRASLINDEHSDLQAEAFSPDANGPFLVVVGGGTTKQAAGQMLQQAIKDGMPRDTYIQNYNH